jgi:hypothetical protein
LTLPDEIGKDFVRLEVAYECAHRDGHELIGAVLSVAIAALTMFASLGLPVGVVLEIQHGSEARAGHEVDVAALSPIPAVRPPTWDVLFPPETAATVAARTRGHSDACSIDKHGKPLGLEEERPEEERAEVLHTILGVHFLSTSSL